MQARRWLASGRTAARRVGLAVAVVVLATSVAACAGERAPAGEAREGRAGIRFTGTMDGRQVSVRDTAPELVFGECSPRTGPDQSVCMISQSIGGETFVLVFHNREALEAGVALDVDGSPCRGAECGEVSEYLVVDVQLADQRVRARGGEVDVELVEPLVRYRGQLRLELPRGTLAGSFDVVPGES